MKTMHRKSKLSIVILFSLLFYAQVSFSQTKLILRPYIGLGSGFWHFSIKPDGEWFTLTKYLEPNKHVYGYSAPYILHKEVGLLLEIGMKNKKYSLLTGITTGIASYAYDIYLGTRTDTMLGTNQPYTHKYYNGNDASFALIRVPVYIEYPILSFTRDKTDSIDGKSYTYHHHQTLSLIGGISFNYEINPPRPLPGYYTLHDSNNSVYNNDSVGFTEYAHSVSRFGVSVNAGLIWTIYSKRKPKELISFTLMFEQGTFNMVSGDLYIYWNNQMWHKQVSTRGSQVLLNVSIPITLFKKRRTRPPVNANL